MSVLEVDTNTPRLLERDQAPPTSNVDELPPEVPQRYWTPEKAAHVVARIGHAGSKFYGPSVKFAEWELDLVSDPAAAVMNDWLPLRVGAGGDRQANLIALVVVVFILVLLRLPDILEVHGVLKPWRSPEEKRRELEQRREQPAAPAAPAAPPGPPADLEPPDPRRAAFEPTLVGAGASARSSDEKFREEVYGGGTVGGGKFADMPT